MQGAEKNFQKITIHIFKRVFRVRIEDPALSPGFSSIRSYQSLISKPNSSQLQTKLFFSPVFPFAMPIASCYHSIMVLINKAWDLHLFSPPFPLAPYPTGHEALLVPPLKTVSQLSSYPIAVALFQKFFSLFCPHCNRLPTNLPACDYPSLHSVPRIIKYGVDHLSLSPRRLWWFSII